MRESLNSRFELLNTTASSPDHTAHYCVRQGTLDNVLDMLCLNKGQHGHGRYILLSQTKQQLFNILYKIYIIFSINYILLHT